MKQVMPSQVVQTIDELFPHAAKGVGNGQLEASSHGPQLLGIVSLIEDIPPELLSFSPEYYAELVLAVSAIKAHLTAWTAFAGKQRMMQPVKGRDAVTVIRRALAVCSDEYPPPSTTTLSFITDDALRENIRSDVGTRHVPCKIANGKARQCWRVQPSRRCCCGSLTKRRMQP